MGKAANQTFRFTCIKCQQQSHLPNQGTSNQVFTVPSRNNIREVPWPILIPTSTFSGCPEEREGQRKRKGMGPYSPQGLPPLTSATVVKWRGGEMQCVVGHLSRTGLKRLSCNACNYSRRCPPCRSSWKKEGGGSRAECNGRHLANGQVCCDVVQWEGGWGHCRLPAQAGLLTLWCWHGSYRPQANCNVQVQ